MDKDKFLALVKISIVSDDKFDLNINSIINEVMQANKTNKLSQ